MKFRGVRQVCWAAAAGVAEAMCLVLEWTLERAFRVAEFCDRKAMGVR